MLEVFEQQQQQQQQQQRQQQQQQGRNSGGEAAQFHSPHLARRDQALNAHPLDQSTGGSGAGELSV